MVIVMMMVKMVMVVVIVIGDCDGGDDHSTKFKVVDIASAIAMQLLVTPTLRTSSGQLCAPSDHLVLWPTCILIV